MVGRATQNVDVVDSESIREAIDGVHFVLRNKNDYRARAHGGYLGACRLARLWCRQVTLQI